MQFDDIVIDETGLSVSKAGRALNLEPHSVQVLLHLAQNAGRVVPAQELLGERSMPLRTERALARSMDQLRQALGERYIETTPEGYRFLGPALKAPPPPRVVPPPGMSTPEAPWWRRMLVPVGAVLAIALAFFLRAVLPEPDNSIPALGARQVIEGNGWDGHPSFSPDGTSLIYSSDRTGKLEIYNRLAETGGSRDVAVTNDGGQNVQPAWSPDGKLVAYHSLAHNGIWIAPALGGATRQISEFGSQPSWSADSRRVVFCSQSSGDLAPGEAYFGGPSNLWIASPYAPGSQELTRRNEPEGIHVNPSFSPDGRYVLFVSHTGPGQSTLWEINIDSRDLRKIETGTPRVYSPRYTPDGSGIFYFGSGEGPGVGMWAVGIDKHTRQQWRKPERVMEIASGEPADLAIGLETRRLAYSLVSLSSSFRRGTGSGQDAEVAAGPPVPEQRVSPDGKSVVFHKDEAGVFNIWKKDLASNQLTQLTHEAESAAYPVWSPDGKQVAFALYRSGNVHLAVVSSQGGEVRQLTDRPGRVWPSSWSAARGIAVAARWDGVWNLYAVSPSSGSPVALTGNTLARVIFRNPEWDAAGKSLLYERRELRGNIFVAEPAAPGQNKEK